MQLDLGLAVSHHLLIFTLFGLLIAELVLTAPGLGGKAIRLLGLVDIWYGIAAAAILSVGVVRTIYAAKGWAYYSVNLFFWAKLSVFVLIAALSIRPTLGFGRWRRAFKATGALPATEDVAAVRRALWTEVALFALLPLFAAAMARGFAQDILG